MLWAVISLICLSSFSIVKAQCTGGTFSVNSGENNYAVDLFSGMLPLAFAVNRCTSVSFVPGSYRQYKCVYTNESEWVIERKSYGTEDCSGDAVDSVILTDAATDFKCDGEDTYAKLYLTYGDDPDCTVKSAVYAGLAACIVSSAQPLYPQFYCGSNTNAKVNLFLPDYMGNETTSEPYESCDARLYCRSWTITGTCSLITSSPVAISGYIDECHVATGTTTTQSSAVSVSFSLALLVSLVLALLH